MKGQLVLAFPITDTAKKLTVAALKRQAIAYTRAAALDAGFTMLAGAGTALVNHELREVVAAVAVDAPEAAMGEFHEAVAHE